MPGWLNARSYSCSCPIARITLGVYEISCQAIYGKTTFPLACKRRPWQGKSEKKNEARQYLNAAKMRRRNLGGGAGDVEEGVHGREVGVGGCDTLSRPRLNWSRQRPALMGLVLSQTAGQRAPVCCSLFLRAKAVDPAKRLRCSPRLHGVAPSRRPNAAIM